ncbi:uncharacterized protein DEA37_0013561, partial [Paragonimus westermani]
MFLKGILVFSGILIYLCFHCSRFREVMVSKTSMSCNQSSSSTVGSIDRMLHNGLLDAACQKLHELHCQKAGKANLRLDSAARAYIVDYTASIIKNLCDPFVPLSVSDVIDRIHYSFPPKLKPPDPLLEEMRVLVDKGKKKTSYIPADKILSCLKTICPRIETSVSLFITHLIEYILGQIIQVSVSPTNFRFLPFQWAVNYETKLDSGLIEETDILQISSLFGTPKFSKASVCQSLPFLQRQSTDYIGHARELQFFLRTCVEHLGIVVRVFGDPIADELSQLRLAAQSTFIGGSSGCELAMAAVNLLQSAQAAQQVFSRAADLYSHMTLLSECVEDVFEGQSHLLGTCLIEPAEDETFHSFAYYSEALSTSDCRNWTSLLAETPCLIRALNTDYQTILRTVLEKSVRYSVTVFTQASSRRLADLETRYSDPHACSMCTSGTGSDSGGGVGSNAVSSSGTSYSNSSHLADSPQSLPALSGLLARVHTSGTCTCSVRTGSNADPPGGIPMPVSSSGGSHNSRHTASPSRHAFVAASNPSRTSALRLPMATTMPLRKQRKQRVSRRSVSGSPSPPANFLDIKVNDPGMSTSSSSSSALNEGGSKSGLDSGSHSYEPRHGFAESDEHSPSSLSLKELQARLMELFPSQTNSGTGPTSCSHMVIAFRYLLPQLLQLPMLQLLYLFEIIEALHLHAKEEAECAILKDVLSMLSKTRLSIQNSMSSTQDWVKSMAPRLANFLKTPLSRSVLSPEALQQLEELVQSVRRTLHPSADRSISVSEFILDGLVQTRTEGNRSRRSDRIAYLFNNWLLLCKKQRRVLLGNVVSSTGSSTHSSLKVKKRISLEQFHLIDSGIEVTDNNGKITQFASLVVIDPSLVVELNDVLFTFDLEYWEVPRRGSLLPDSQPTGTSLGSGPSVVGDSQSLHSTRSAHTVIPTLCSSPPNSTCSQVGSVLSISTLTSTNTLVSSPGALSHGVQASTTGEPDGAVSTGFTPMMPTAGAAAAAACVAVLGALSATPTQRVTFLFSSQADKADWMAALVYLQLGRLFKRYLRDLPRQEVPLVLPSPSVYRFAAPDSITNIIFDSDIPDSSVEIPVIRAATVLKLIERMTYHAYFDSKTVGVFLM